ncbi:MAG: hypothetical protein QM711_04920, partial [Micropruina sp.]|uniref:hypothetical protein n=1 Tax=Micropruina sp. TaxID=2737536 RepID=UPI0039E678A3
VRVIAKRDPLGNLNLETIAIKFREDAQETVVDIKDKRLDWAIYLARSAFALKGEAEFHLAEGHILPGICAKVLFKHIRPENPLYAPLAPHLGELDFINWFGSQGLIFGKGSVLETSALNAQAVTDVIIKSVNEKADWLNYVPPSPLTPGHYRAKCEKLHFHLLWVFFKHYVEKNREEITKHWKSIYNWSQGMCQLIPSMPPVTQQEELPNELDLKHLARFMAWLVSKTTFVHWSAHSRQQLLTDVEQASLAVEKRALDNNGNLDRYGNTEPDDMIFQLNVSRTLLNFDGDSFFKNPHGDINQELLDSLRKHLSAYKGYDDILKMHLTTQI